MLSTADILTSLECCPRKGYWSTSWERVKFDSTEMLRQAIGAAVTCADRPDFGEFAGEEVMRLAEERGLETKSHQVYDACVHLACLADILSSAIRNPSLTPWIIPESTERWRSSAFLSPDGSTLRRLCLATSWSDERHYSEIRSWHSLGEIAQYKLPMQQVVLVLGVQRDGRRHSPWTKGLLHPRSHQLRFRKQGGGPFKETWERIWREDHAEIDRMAWLQGMLNDDVLRDVCFNVEIPVPGEVEVQRLRDMAARKMEQLARMTELPDQQLSTCDWPVPCVFQRECHGGEAPGEGRFVSLGPRAGIEPATRCLQDSRSSN